MSGRAPLPLGWVAAPAAGEEWSPLGPPSVLAVTGPPGDIREVCRWNIFMGRVFLLPIFEQEARHLSHLSLCQPLPDINWGRGKEMKDSLDTAQCAGATCQAMEHKESLAGLPLGWWWEGKFFIYSLPT